MPTVCTVCGKQFARPFTLNRHISEVHKNKNTVTKNKSNFSSYQCLEANCGSFQNNKNLMSHLEKLHNMKFEMESICFENLNEFEAWKSKIEISTSSSYIIKSKSTSTTGEIRYYRCNRSKTSHVIKPNEQRNRSLKSQGSCKMDSSCTSQIRLIMENGKFLVEWQKVHYGHTLDLQHIRLPKLEKQNIAVKLVKGVTSRRILESTRDNIREDLKRVDLLTAKDLSNIKTSFGVETKQGKRSSNDAFSVDLWVAECQTLQDNPILFYKAQGNQHDVFKPEDFCLIIMNKFQKHIITKFPNLITIDSTHGLNSYDFELTTIMVIDEYNHGFPVAEMFTNRKDTLAQVFLFRSVKDAVGNVACNIFMSDMAETFFNGWQLVMDGSPKHLYCSWHVDRAWQSGLNKILNKEKRASIYKMLKSLQQETAKEHFYTAFHNAISFMCSDIETQSFGEYFKNTYLRTVKKWAYCFRENVSVNTNMHLESMHKTIKYFYLERKTVKRLDKGLNAVLKYVRDKSVERIIRLTKGENTRFIREISQNHKNAIKDGAKYTVIDHNTHWEVKKSDVSYLIHKKLTEKCCKQICIFCNVCIHMFTCNCKYFCDRKNICRHIHILLEGKNNQSEATSTNKLLVSDKSELLQCLSNFRDTNENCSVNSQRINSYKIRNLLFTLENINYDEIDEEILSQIHQHLIIVNSLGKCSNSSESRNDFVTKIESQKRNITKQHRFTSTKKKRKVGVASFQRAVDAQEKLQIQENLIRSSTDPFLVTSLSSSYDHQY